MGFAIQITRLFIFLCVGLKTGTALADKRVNILIASDLLAAPESVAGQYVTRLRENFLGDVLYYRVQSVSEFKNVFDLLPADHLVQSITFLGIHGQRDANGVPRFAVVNQNGQKEWFYLHDFKTVFPQYYSHDAKIFFWACNIVLENSPTATLHTFRYLKDSLNFSSGSIYANYSKGSDAFASMYATTPFEHPVWQRNVEKLFWKLFWFVGGPITLTQDYLNNRGFFYHLDNQQNESLQKIHFYRARQPNSSF